MNLISKLIMLVTLFSGFNAFGDTVVQSLMKEKVKQKVESEMGFDVTKIELNRPDGLTGKAVTIFRGEYTREAFIHTKRGFILNCLAEIKKNEPTTATLFNCSIYLERLGPYTAMQLIKE